MNQLFIRSKGMAYFFSSGFLYLCVSFKCNRISNTLKHMMHVVNEMLARFHFDHITRIDPTKY